MLELNDLTILKTYIEEKGSQITTKVYNNELTVNWRVDDIGFHLYIDKEESSKYKCIGEIFVVCEVLETRIVDVIKLTNNEEDVSTLIDAMIKSANFIKNIIKHEERKLND